MIYNSSAARHLRGARLYIALNWFRQGIPRPRRVSSRRGQQRGAPESERNRFKRDRNYRRRQARSRNVARHIFL